MKTIRNVVSFQRNLYAKSSKYIMPLVVLCAFLLFAYQQKGERFVESMNISSVVCFYIMMWIGMNYHENQEDVLEQLMILRIKSEKKYYFCQDIVLFELSFLVSIISVGYAVLCHIINNFTLFKDNNVLVMMWVALFLHIITSFAGAEAGAFFHKRIFRKRKAATFIMAFIAIVAISSKLIIREFPITKYVLWIAPPVSHYVVTFKDMISYNFKSIIIGAGIMFIYTIVITVIKDYLLIRNKF